MDVTIAAMNDEMPAPSPVALERAAKLLAPWRLLTSPRFEGLERIPDARPLLFVGNHTILGLVDAPLMLAELWEKKGIALRSLGDHAHFKVPVWGELLRSLGVVDGTRENCGRLMRAGEAILVFPGGAREVAKRKGEKYRLIWKERLGFARLAIQHACTIVPFAAVGAEDAYDIVADADDLFASPIGPALKKLGVRPDLVMPLVKGLGPTPLPRPERLYFRFEEPIATTEWAGREEDDDACRALRDRARSSVESGIAALLELRERDQKRGLLGRIKNEITRRRRRD